MDVREFTEELQNRISERLNCEVSVQEVTKNNGITLTGLLIKAGDANVYPTIYTNDFYNAYQTMDVDLDKVAERIIKLYFDEKPSEGIDMSFFRDFHKVRDGICYMLVNKDANSKFLNRVPNFEFLDLAICFYYDFFDSRLGSGKIAIHNSHMDMWGVTPADLLAAAYQNTSKRKPAIVKSMEEVIQKMLAEASGVGKDIITDIPSDLKEDMLIVTNETMVNGAACMLYSSVLEDIAEAKESDLILLPSSIHEIIVIKKDASDVDYWKDIVYTINRGQVEPEEVLSDSVYVYNRYSKKISIA